MRDTVNLWIESLQIINDSFGITTKYMSLTMNFSVFLTDKMR